MKGKVGPNVRWKLLAIAGGIGFQGFLGWYMVSSGLSEDIMTTPGAVPRVSQYRLAMHLGAALLLYTGMLHTALSISKDWKYAMGQGKTAGVEAKSLLDELNQPSVRRFASGLAWSREWFYSRPSLVSYWRVYSRTHQLADLAHYYTALRRLRGRSRCWIDLQ